MPSKVNVHEAKTQLSKLLDRAHRGEEVVISKGGKPYARLMPLEPPPPRKGGWLAGKLGKGFWEPLPDEELEAWER
ncbi:MAG TPA: type II toxin-antitoxin system prevent-host-death family antitoxin [Myxococcaceae bacterium]|jgi:prevent-host-death family protein